MVARCRLRPARSPRLDRRAVVPTGFDAFLPLAHVHHGVDEPHAPDHQGKRDDQHDEVGASARVLALVHKGLEPPDEKVDKTTAQTAEWRMEYDVVRTLKVLGHEVRVIGVHDDLTPIRSTMD